MKKSPFRLICVIFAVFLLLSPTVFSAQQNNPNEFEFTLTYEDGRSIYPAVSVGYMVMPKLKFTVANGKITGAIDDSIELKDLHATLDVSVSESGSGTGVYSKDTGKFSGNFECKLVYYMANDVFAQTNQAQHMTGTFSGKTLGDGGIEIACSATVVFLENNTYSTGGNRTEQLSQVVFINSFAYVLEYAVDSTARFNSLTGQVEIGRDQDDTMPCTLKTVINVGDYIVTGKNSRCIIQFSDMSTFVLKENAAIRIKSPPAKETKLELVLGRIWGNLKRGFAGDGQLNIEMAQAVAGIKGTTYVCEENNGVSTLKVLDGVVEFTAKADNSMVTVNKGEQVSADANGLTPVTSFNLAEEEAAWAEFTEDIKESDSKEDKETRPRQGNDGPGTVFYILVAVWVLVFIGWAAAVIIVLAKRKKNKF